MPKKKPQRNGMYWFMQDLLPELRREGMNFPNGMADVVPLAHPRWKALPPAERERYEKKARDERKKKGSQDADKYRFDNVGNIIADRVDASEEHERRRIKEAKITKSRWPKDEEEFLDHPMYFLSFEYLWKPEEDRTSLPVEIGIVEFTLRDGIKNTFQRFIKPRTSDGRTIPMGFRFQCKQQSEDRHQIPIEGFELAEDNYRGLWIQMENFVNKDGKKKEYPPLYVLEADLHCVEYCMDWIHSQARIGQISTLGKIFELETMVVDLFSRKEKPISRGAVIDLLTCSNYDYEPNTRCEWHDQQDTRFCALATVKKYCYYISDALADIYDFELTPKHLPQKTATRSYKVVAPVPPVSMSITSDSRGSWRSVPRPAPPPTKPQTYSAFASRDIRYRERDLEEEENPPPAHPSFAEPYGTDLGRELRAPPKKTLSQAVAEKNASKPCLHDVMAEKHLQTQFSMMGVHQNHQPARVGGEGHLQPQFCMMGVHQNHQPTSGPAMGRGGRGLGRGRGRGTTPPGGDPPRPGSAPGATPSGRGRGVAGGPCPVNVSGPPIMQSPPPMAHRAPKTMPKVLLLQKNNAATAAAASRDVPLPAGGRGRGIFKAPDSAPSTVPSRPPPGFGRGVTIELS